jgi:hypothetical protein
MLEFIDTTTADILVYIFWFFTYFFLLQFSYWLGICFFDLFFAANKQESGQDENINIFFHDDKKNVSIKRKII